MRHGSRRRTNWPARIFVTALCVGLVALGVWAVAGGKGEESPLPQETAAPAPTQEPTPEPEPTLSPEELYYQEVTQRAEEKGTGDPDRPGGGPLLPELRH